VNAEDTALIVVQARMSSTRLPGKVLADIGGEPALALLLRRLSHVKAAGRVAVATSTDRSDEPIAIVAARLGAMVVRGPLEDVLARFAIAIAGHSGPVVRITGDCPLSDPALVDATLELYRSTPGCSYASNIEPRCYPDGLDVEVIAAEALRAVASEALTASEREHVTTVIRNRPDRFAAVSLRSPQDLGELRWTVDDEADLEFVRAVVTRLAERRHVAGLEEILATVRRFPSLASFGGARRA
jgi:spore coat polysaccharide biosynthesis protein SpsF (cytidylyltransferase family)